MNEKCKLLKIYLKEDSRYEGHNLYHAIVFKLKELGIAGVTVTRSVEGYGKDKKLHNAKMLDLHLSLPVIIDVIDTEENIQKALPIVTEIVNEGLVLLADITVLKSGKDSSGEQQ